MQTDTFIEMLRGEFGEFRRVLATGDGDWTVKGFIDVYKNIYTISVDTKVISKIIELMIFPIIARFAERHRLSLILSEHQNHYPDISFVTPGGEKFALDLKSTYRVSKHRVNGFTLGAFTGYFRRRDSTKNVTFPYSDYKAHLVLGIIYSRAEVPLSERRAYRVEDLQSIVSVVNSFEFLIHEKWRIANDRPGSGNTRNIGSVREIDALLAGSGPFAAYGPDVFNHYWQHYLTREMARAIDSEAPYRNLQEYWEWRKKMAG